MAIHCNGGWVSERTGVKERAAARGRSSGMGGLCWRHSPHPQLEFEEQRLPGGGDGGDQL